MDSRVTFDEQRAFEGQLATPTDFKIRIDKYEWHVHGRLISSNSTFFEKACNGEWNEAENKIITLHDDDPWVVADAILWMYTQPASSQYQFEYGISGPLDKMMFQNITDHAAYGEDRTKHLERKPWEKICQLYQFANKYEIKGLVVETRNRLGNALIEDVSLVSEITELLGNIVFMSDPDLGMLLIRAWLQEVSDAELVHDKLNKLFESDKGAMALVRKHLFAIMRDTQLRYEGQTQYVNTAISQVRQAAINVHRQRNPRVKQDYKQISKTLKEAQKLGY